VKRPNLSPEASENLRCRLISELEQPENAEDLATWAHGVLPLKNQLSTADARLVEAAFAAKLTQLENAAPPAQAEKHTNGHDLAPKHASGSSDEVTVIGKPTRERDPGHLRFVAAQPCLVCGRTPSDPHHFKFAEQRDGAQGQRPLHGADLPASPSGASPARRRARLVADTRNRSRGHCGEPLGQDACCVADCEPRRRSKSTNQRMPFRHPAPASK